MKLSSPLISRSSLGVPRVPSPFAVSPTPPSPRRSPPTSSQLSWRHAPQLWLLAYSPPLRLRLTARPHRWLGGHSRRHAHRRRPPASSSTTNHAPLRACPPCRWDPLSPTVGRPLDLMRLPQLSLLSDSMQRYDRSDRAFRLIS